MRTTIDKAGRLVIPKALRDQVGLGSGEVELAVDGRALRIEAVVADGLGTDGEFLVIPASGSQRSDGDIRRCVLPTSAELKSVLVDPSVAVAASPVDHRHHDSTLAALRGRTIGLAGHAAYEMFSVLTRLPAPARRGTGEIARLLAHNFPATRYRSAEGAASLSDELKRLDIADGALYDALVGGAACEHGVVLVTRDRRTFDT